MTLKHQAAQLFKRIALGSDDLPQQCPIGLRDPQTEVSVFLHGLGATRDVTRRHFMASGAPVTIGISSPNEWDLQEVKRSQPSLHFREQGGGQQLLGTIGLTHKSTVSVGNHRLHLFGVRRCSNYCMPRARLWVRYLEYAYLRHRAPDTDVPVTAGEVHSMIVFYACPRPVVLVSVSDGTAGNVFPMNLMGPIGDRFFCFALNNSRAAAPLVERSGHIAISNIPVEHTSLAISLGKNHRKESVDWDQVPFATCPSSAFRLPVPRFALRVRELEIETATRIGSHTLFVARIIHDERRADGPQFFVVHGIYQAWRAKQLSHLAAQS